MMLGPIFIPRAESRHLWHTSLPAFKRNRTSRGDSEAAFGSLRRTFRSMAKDQEEKIDRSLSAFFKMTFLT